MIAEICLTDDGELELYVVANWPTEMSMLTMYGEAFGLHRDEDGAAWRSKKKWPVQVVATYENAVCDPTVSSFALERGVR